MASAKRKSSRPSATSSTSRPENPLLFIDRDAWSGALGAALDDAGIGYIAHRARFDADSPDTEWIAAASAEGWIAITRDQNIRRKPNELFALRQSHALVLVFTSGNLSAAMTASILLRALPQVYRLARTVKRPALFSIRKDASIGKLRL